MEKCVACQFYDRDEARSADKGVRWGKCRRGVPIVHPVSAKSYMVEGIWPHVRDDDWCGEWAAHKHRQPASPDPRNLLMQAAGTPPAHAGALATAGSLMTPMSSGEATLAANGTHFGSD
ncbi:MAG: hypothetical protein ACM3JC_12165 [Rudaea sp.]